jgi:hypothetical protein
VKHGLKNLFLVIFIFLLGFLTTLVWLTNEATEDFTEYKSFGINNYNIEFKNNTIQLRLDLGKPMSCKEAINIIGITPIDVRGQLYSPICIRVNDKEILISYRKVTDV